MVGGKGWVIFWVWWKAESAQQALGGKHRSSGEGGGRYWASEGNGGGRLQGRAVEEGAGVHCPGKGQTPFRLEQVTETLSIVLDWEMARAQWPGTRWGACAPGRNLGGKLKKARLRGTWIFAGFCCMGSTHAAKSCKIIGPFLMSSSVLPSSISPPRFLRLGTFQTGQGMV